MFITKLLPYLKYSRGIRKGVRGGSNEHPFFSWNKEIYAFILLANELEQKKFMYSLYSLTRLSVYICVRENHKYVGTVDEHYAMDKPPDTLLFSKLPVEKSCIRPSTGGHFEPSPSIHKKYYCIFKYILLCICNP